MKDTKIDSVRKSALLLLWLLYLAIGSDLANATEKDSIINSTNLYSEQLENGFTYYIKPVKNGGDKIKMELIVRSGANRQNRNQWGLAHFLEHLPITQFKKKAYDQNSHLKKSLENDELYMQGSTDFNYTRYTFSYSKDDHNLHTVALDYFAEIASGELQLDQGVLDSEKGIFHQELIQSLTDGSQVHQGHRINAALSSCLTVPVESDSLWNHIQRFNVLDTQNFLNQWYQPKLSSLIIVGDIEDAELYKTKVKKVFSSLENKAKRKIESKCSQNFMDSSSSVLVLESNADKQQELKEVNFHLLIRDDKKFNEISDKHWEFLKPILSQTINKLLFESQEEYNVRYKASANWNHILPLLDIFVSTQIGKEAQSLDSTYSLIKDLKQNGITEKYWKKIQDRGAQNLQNKDTSSLSYWEHQLNQYALNKHKGSLNSEENLLSWWHSFTMEDFNAILNRFLPDEPDDIAIIAPVTTQKNKKYWESQTKKWISSVSLNGSKPNFYNVGSLDLKANLKAKGHREVSQDTLGARTFLLENGIRVILKETQKTLDNNGKIYLQGFNNKGGLNFSKDNYGAALLSPFIIRNAGIGNLDKFQLEELISNSSISSFFPYVYDLESGIKGKCQEQDLDLFFQLIYSYFASPRKDNVAFENWKYQEWERNLNPPINKSNSDFRFQVNSELNVPTKKLSVSERYEAVRKINQDSAYEVYNSIFGNAKDFTFLISSSIEAEKLLPLIDKYLGNLPNSSEEVIGKKPVVEKSPRGPVLDTLTIPSIPYDNVILSVQYLKAMELFDWKTRLQLKVLAEVISSRINQLRYINRRAIYYSYSGYVSNIEMDQVGVSITIPTLKIQAKPIVDDINTIVQEIVNKPIQKDELDSILEHKIIPQYSNDWENNLSKKLELLYNYHRFKILPPEESIAKKYIFSLSPELLKETANRFFKAENRYQFIGVPLSN